MRFPEEQQALKGLLNEWYDALKAFTERANGIFTAKAAHYDRISPVWHRIEWPRGFVQELRKKTDRLAQLLAGFREDDVDGSVDWDAVDDELLDILNYARMAGGINEMVRRRSSGS